METLPNIAMGDKPTGDYYIETVYYPNKMKCRFCISYKEDLHAITLSNGDNIEFDGFCKIHPGMMLSVNRGDGCALFRAKKIDIVKPRKSNDKVGVNVEIKQN